MKQELQTIGAPHASSRGTVKGRGFAVLFALAGSDTVDAETVGRRLGLSESACREALDALQREYLVDCISHLEGDSVKETLRLTEEGRAVLLSSLELMCELPESP